MSMLKVVRDERTELLSRLRSLRVEIKVEEMVDLDEKWDVLQQGLASNVKIGGMHKLLGDSFFNTLSTNESLRYNMYTNACADFTEALQNIEHFYESEDQEGIITKMFKHINAMPDTFSRNKLKRQLINNLSEHRKNLL